MPDRIQLQRVSKAYRIGESQTSLRESIMSAARRLTHKSKENDDLFWALRDVSFSVGEGEALGLIGPNGAGKTTILKLISNITQPLSGRIHTTERVSSLIELGAGFHPDLSGRDNIYLNGTILGMSRRQIRDRFDAIVAFSGLEKFLDTPVKRYSSGMYARLAFSVAAWTEAKVLLVDEVLAVGDLGFQARCVQRMRELVRNGATVVFVSHSLYYINYFCNRAILLNNGQIASAGSPQTVIEHYQELMKNRPDEQRSLENAVENSADQSIGRIISVETLDERGKKCAAVEVGGALTLRMRGIARRELHSPVVRFSIFSADGVRCFSAHNQSDGMVFPDVRGEFEIRLNLYDLHLAPGSYSVSAGLLETGAIGRYDWKEFCAGFKVHHREQRQQVESGVVYVPHRWQVKIEGPASFEIEPLNDGSGLSEALQ